jgi:hypothetical protein
VLPFYSLQAGVDLPVVAIVETRENIVRSKLPNPVLTWELTEVDRVGCHSSEVFSSIVPSRICASFCGCSINTEIEYGQSVSNDDVGVSRKEFHDSSDGEDDNSIRAVVPSGNLVTRNSVSPVSEDLTTDKISSSFPLCKGTILEEVVGRRVFSHTLRSGGCSADCMVSLILNQLLLECGLARTTWTEKYD